MRKPDDTAETGFTPRDAAPHSLRLQVRRGQLAAAHRENAALELDRREPEELFEPVTAETGPDPENSERNDEAYSSDRPSRS